MSRRAWFATLLALTAAVPLGAIVPERDFSGHWTPMPGTAGPGLIVTQTDSAVRCTQGGANWTITLDGSESRYKIGEEHYNSIAKWEGAALLINTLVSGP